MGLLDDAIREHLDLKRRRGADPAEIERAEQEALGPVRRGPEAPQPANGDDDAPLAYDHEDDSEWEEEDIEERAPAAAAPAEQEYDPFADEEDARHAADDVDDEPEPPTRGRAPLQDEEPFAEDEPFADEPPAATPPRSSADAGSAAPPPHPAAGTPPASAGGETVEYDALSPEADEDVLEETPEFLQDTPDHDRLWFEQKPPRDFDFND